VATESDRIRADIERTRGELADNVSMLADRTSPKRIVERRWDAVKDRAQTVSSRAKDNPLAAGFIAFGVGLLAAAALPESDAERRMGQQLADQTAPLLEPVRSAAADVAGQVKGSAQQAAAEVGESVKQGAARTTEQLRS
jgi:Protein of unknown function (DUF3618)